MKIRIEQKELKGLLEKVLSQTAKKTKVTALECVLLESKSGVLSASATDLESFLTVTTDSYNNVEDGKLLIHRDDIKLISKLSGELEINALSESEAVIKTDKKSISIRLYDIEGYPVFPQANNNKSLFTIQENQFTTAINKLIKFVSDNENNKTMQCYNINMKHNRIEALDGHRVGTIDITPEIFVDSKTIMIHSKINNHLKKVLDIKSTEHLQFAEQDNVYIITGTDFTYVQRIVAGEYYKVEQLLSTEYDLSMKVNTKELMDIAKFNLDISIKEDKKPLILNYNKESDSTHIYFNNGKNKTLDKLETKETNINKDFMIGFNPKFIYEAMKCIEDDIIKIEMTSPKAPALIHATGEKYLVLPVNIGNDDSTEKEVNNYIKQAA